MDLMEAILTRRSIRKYEPGTVTPAQIDDLLRAAMAAPSAGNQQPWRFVISTDSDKLSQVADFHPHGSMLAHAAAGILVCGDPTVEKHQGMWVQDCAAAVQNTLLSAHALGLGAVWVGIHPRPEREEGFRKLFDLPSQIIPFAIVSIGHPGEKKEPSNRFDESKIHWERW